MGHLLLLYIYVFIHPFLIIAGFSIQCTHLYVLLPQLWLRAFRMFSAGFLESMGILQLLWWASAVFWPCSFSNINNQLFNSVSFLIPRLKQIAKILRPFVLGFILCASHARTFSLLNGYSAPLEIYKHLEHHEDAGIGKNQFTLLHLQIQKVGILQVFHAEKLPVYLDVPHVPFLTCYVVRCSRSLIQWVSSCGCPNSRLEDPSPQIFVLRKIMKGEITSLALTWMMRQVQVWTARFFQSEFWAVTNPWSQSIVWTSGLITLLPWSLSNKINDVIISCTYIMHYFDFSGSVVCVGSEWHRFPSSFFVPSYVGEVRWIDDGFRGLLPFPFNSTIGGTRAAPPYFNNKNKASDEQYVFFCPLLIYSGFSCMYFSIRFLVAFQWWQHPVFPDVTAQGSWCLYFPCGAGPEKAVSFSWKWLIEMGGKNQFNFYWFSIQQEHFIFTKTVVQHVLAHLNTCVKKNLGSVAGLCCTWTDTSAYGIFVFCCICCGFLLIIWAWWHL